jgi:LSD1 subclass zinc finger protein
MHIVTANQVAHVNCGNCRMLLMYQYGARSVKCAVCNFVTSVGVSICIFSTHFKHLSGLQPPPPTGKKMFKKKKKTFSVLGVFFMDPLKKKKQFNAVQPSRVKFLVSSLLVALMI